MCPKEKVDISESDVTNSLSSNIFAVVTYCFSDVNLMWCNSVLKLLTLLRVQLDWQLWVKTFISVYVYVFFNVWDVCLYGCCIAVCMLVMVNLVQVNLTWKCFIDWWFSLHLIKIANVLNFCGCAFHESCPVNDVIWRNIFNMCAFQG